MKVKITKSLLKQAVKQLIKQANLFSGQAKMDDTQTTVRDCTAVDCYNNNSNFKSGCQIQRIGIGPNGNCQNFVSKSQLGLKQYNQNDNPGRKLQHVTKYLRSESRSQGYRPKVGGGRSNMSDRYKSNISGQKVGRQ